jgi:hypothetical protein
MYMYPIKSHQRSGTSGTHTLVPQPSVWEPGYITTWKYMKMFRSTVLGDLSAHKEQQEARCPVPTVQGALFRLDPRVQLAHRCFPTCQNLGFTDMQPTGIALDAATARVCDVLTCRIRQFGRLCDSAFFPYGVDPSVGAPRCQTMEDLTCIAEQCGHSVQRCHDSVIMTRSAAKLLNDRPIQWPGAECIRGI